MESEAKKKFLMKVGIISVMALILIFWVLNMKNVFRNDAVNTNDQSLAQLRNIKNDFNNTITEINQNLSTVGAATSTSPSNIATSSFVSELIKETNSNSSSTEVKATSSLPIIPVSSSTPVKVNPNCPAYINCMPTIGAARDCTIPLGCEGITQIAY